MHQPGSGCNGSAFVLNYELCYVAKVLLARLLTRESQMSGERAWVETVKEAIEAVLPQQGLVVATGFRLPYAFHVDGYKGKAGELSISAPEPISHGYQTDVLIAEQLPTAWTPRVVVEFKLGAVTTHDALTYSAKAATHKNVHPYLRYGIVIGRFEGAVPRRLIRHGHQFDFMMTIPSEELSIKDRDRIAQLLMDELRASQTMSKLLSEKSSIRLLHRMLAVHR